jgi:hypothetical protein
MKSAASLEGTSVKADPIQVEIVCKEGPVVIPSLDMKGIDAKYELWNDMFGSEFFPAKVESASYVLTLSKGVCHSSDVWGVEGELHAALKLLSRAWPFSGGSFFIIETYEVLKKDRRESNAKDVEKNLLAREDRHPISTTATMHFESLATYSQPPLAIASQLAKAMNRNHALAKLLEYTKRHGLNIISTAKPAARLGLLICTKFVICCKKFTNTTEKPARNCQSQLRIGHISVTFLTTMIFDTLS